MNADEKRIFLELLSALVNTQSAFLRTSQALYTVASEMPQGAGRGRLEELAASIMTENESIYKHLGNAVEVLQAAETRHE